MHLVSRSIPMFGMDGAQYMLVPFVAGVIILAAFFAAFSMKDDMYKD